MSEPHWHVLGAGAIGCLYADALQRSGCRTSLLLRKGHTEKLVPVTVERDGVQSTQQLPAVDGDNPGRISHLLVTTKAFDAHPAVAGIAQALDDQCVLVLLVNGMGLAEQLSNSWPHLNIFCGTTTEGAYRIAARHIHHAGRGETRIGRQGQIQPPAWFATWTRAIDPCLWDANIESALWSKLVVNCIINPLTAVNRCRNGELAEIKHAQQVASLCDEVSRISQAAGYKEIAASLPRIVAQVVAGTADNRSSMLQDVENRRQTEIDYINGYLLKVAERHGIDAPVNRALVEKIESYDRS